MADHADPIPDLARRLAVILAADVAGYSRLMSEDEEGTLKTLSLYQEVVAALVAEHQGRIFAVAGDAIMAEFASPVQAVRCAVAMQRAIHRRNGDLPQARQMTFRIGITIGDVMSRDGDLYGDAVNIAARLQAIVEPGLICIAGSVQEQIAGKLNFPCVYLGEKRVKNIPRPVQAYVVHWTGDAVKAHAQSSPPALPDKPSVAVLPFANMSGDPEQDYFADGLTEDLITALAQFRWFFVIARNSSFAFKGRAMTVQQIGRELGVRYILEGSSRRSGERVRVTAQLIDAESSRHLWAERYDRELADLFAVQDEIVARVVGAIEPEMLKTETVRARQKSPQDLSAWDQILRGMWHFYQVTESDHARAGELFRAATETAPALAEGHTWLARANAGILIYGWSKNPAADVAEGWQAAMRATRLAETDPYAHYALGVMSAAMGQPERTIAEAQKAIDLSPSFALGWLLLGMGRLFAGRAAQGVEPLQHGLRLNPHDPQAFIWLQLLAFAHLLSGGTEEAAQRAREAVAMRPESASGQAALACASVRLGRMEDARAGIAALEQILKENPSALDELLARFSQADRERLREILREAGRGG